MTFDDDTSKSNPFAARRSTGDSVRVGSVVAVTGSHATARLEIAPEQMAAEDRSLQIGSLVKMHMADTTVYGLVKSLSIPEFGSPGGGEEVRMLELELVGEGVHAADGSTRFQRGVSFYPTLGDGIFAVSAEDLAGVYAPPGVSSARIGTIYQDQSLPAYVSVDDLLGKHFAVLGTTGSGKSCGIATILRAILNDHSEGHVLLLDMHGEYGHAFRDRAELLGAGEFKLPYWLLNFEELQEIVVEKTEEHEVDRAILRDAVIYAKRTYHEGDEAGARYDADTPVPYRMSELLRYLDAGQGKLEKPTGAAPFIRLRNRLQRLLADLRFDFMFQERFALDDDMDQILSQLFRVPADGKPITVLDLSAVPSDIMKVVVSLLCRMTFDFAYWGGGKTPVTLVCEEAHRYAASAAAASGFDLTRRALARIGNEGRKYGVSLGIVSQRPSALDIGILSQCSTIFALRMNNLTDQQFVRGTLSESGLGLTDALPSLRTGDAIVVGEGVAVPVRVHLDLLPEDLRPMSATAEFSKAWKDVGAGAGTVDTIVDRWRRQRR